MEPLLIYAWVKSTSFVSNNYVYHMTSLLLSGRRHIIKSYDHMCNNTLARIRNVIDYARVKNAFPY